jgi:hypothetical protein
MPPLFFYIDLDGAIHTDTFFHPINASHWFSRKFPVAVTIVALFTSMFDSGIRCTTNGTLGLSWDRTYF